MPSSNTKVTRHPLTHLDNALYGVIMTLGWVFEGTVDAGKLGGALDRLVEKWPLLSGRIARSDGDRTYHVAVDPEERQKYYLSSHSSEEPLSNYIPVASLPPHSTSYPLAIPNLPLQFMSDDALPKTIQQWVERQAPLLYWHFERFSDGYTCIGFSFHHLVIDGYGVNLIIHRVGQELRGLGDELPTIPLPETNPLLALVDDLRRSKATKSSTDDEAVKETQAGPSPSHEIPTPITLSSMPILSRKLLFISPSRLSALLKERQDGVSRGDVLAAFFLKACQVRRDDPNVTFTLGNVASVHPYARSLDTYIHNAAIPLPYPPFEADVLQRHTVGSLAVVLAETRKSFKDRVIDTFLETLDHLEFGSSKTKTIGGKKGEGNVEQLLMSNLCSFDVANVDWSACLVDEADPSLGADKNDGHPRGRTIFRIRDAIVPEGALSPDVIIIVGHLWVGTLLLDAALVDEKMALLQHAIEAL